MKGLHKASVFLFNSIIILSEKPNDKVNVQLSEYFQLSALAVEAIPIPRVIQTDEQKKKKNKVRYTADLLFRNINKKSIGQIDL